jgi:VWFA-related protein
MKRRLSLILALALLASNVIARTPAATQQQTTRPTAQQPATQQPPTQTTPAPTPTQTTATPQTTPQATPAEESEEDVVRITSNLVQFDATVTDKQGRLVTDLRPEDFEVRVGGRPQEITNLSFVSNETGTVSARPAERAADRNAPPLPPVPLRASQVRRTVALVVDDLGTSFESIAYVRRALKKFVDEQMQPGDLVAVMRTSAGMGALQQFTTDKQLLYRAIDRVRWNPSGRSGLSAFAPLEPDEFAQAKQQAGLSSNNNGTDPAAELEEFRTEIFSVGTLGTLNFIVRGMGELPGRKSVVMFSEGFKIYNGDNPTANARVLDSLRHLVDLANRASVVVYTIDPRGLQTAGLTAADDTGGRSAQDLNDLTNSRMQELLDTQQGLQYLADETGGFLVKNNNDINGAVRRTLDDQKGYYLIGFRPDEKFFEPANGRHRFNSFDVKVKRAGLSVRTRGGFFGVTEGEMKPPPRTRTEQLLAAISSPLRSGELNLRLTSLFNSPGQKAEVVDSLMHIDMSQFKFADEADGWKHAVVDVIAITFGEDGQVVDEINRTENVRARGDALHYILENGVVYGMKVPLKKPGAYQLRVAVRDALTEKIGTASQFIEVPDLRKDRLALSGIFMAGAGDAKNAGGSGGDKTGDAGAAAQTAGAGSQTAAPPNPLRDASVRRFRQASKIDFIYSIYNAHAERAAGRPQLKTRARIFHEGRLVFDGQPQDLDMGKQSDTAHLRAGGRLQLGSSLLPGDYVLQVIVTDESAKAKQRTATQWIDFEIVK